jgi:guanylate kinase
VKEALPEALLVFVQAPSREEQRRRLVARGTETPESLERRLAKAEAEEEIGATRFDHVVVNDDLDRAVAEVAGIVEARRGRSRPLPPA